MTEEQKQFNTFIESACAKCGCPEAVPYLKAGFSLYCEAIDPYVLAKLKPGIKLTSKDGKVFTPEPEPEPEPEPVQRKLPEFKSVKSAAEEIDSAHPEFDRKRLSLDDFQRRQGLINDTQNRYREENLQTQDDYNTQLAYEKANELRRLPFDEVKKMFPSAVCKVSGQRWVREFIGHRKNEFTGKDETYAKGHWEPVNPSIPFDNPTQAADWAKRHFSPGHWEVYNFIPELQPKVTNVIDSDR